MASIRDLLERQQKGLSRLTAEQARAAIPVLDAARETLRRRLGEWTAKKSPRNLAAQGLTQDDRWTAVQTKRSLVLIDEALQQAREGLEGVLQDAVPVADAAARRDMVNQIESLSERFPSLQRVDVDTGLRFMSENGTLLERFSAGSERWSKRAVQSAKAALAEETLAGSSISKVIDRLSAPDGPIAARRSDAQRLVRTEFVNRYNDRSIEGMKSLRDSGDMPSAKKRLVTPMDRRTAIDSLMIVAKPGNVVREIDEPFDDPYFSRTFMHPPNRPNDRSKVVAWDDEWGDDWKEDVRKAGERLAARPVRPSRREQAPARKKAPASVAKVPSAQVLLERKVRKVEKDIRGSDVEIGVAFDEFGNVTTRLRGTKRHLEIPVQIARDLEGKTFTHVHPGGTSFSYDDMSGAIRYNWAELRAVGRGRLRDQGKSLTHVFRPGEKGWPDAAAFAKRWKTIDSETQVMLYQNQLEGRMEKAETDYYHAHIVNKKLAAEFGISYRRILSDE